ncbi:ribonuclease H-like domain-containing protein [Tanacetum coccineum]|uniref:Ribonuclease H-like domain-containing protein n=1 Tax=Tanacetum coccineum TaxID=301880 RepID=A0ABQ5ERN7_9ASTR
MTNPNTGTSEVTTSAGTLQTPNANASEEEDEVEDLIIVPTTVRHVGPRKSSTSSKAHEFLTALQNLKTQEKEAYSTGILEDSPEILDFRRELDDLAQNHLREVPKNKANSTNLVNSGSGIDDAQPADQDGSDMPELTIINKLRKDFERPFLCMTMGLVLISKILTTEKQSAATFRSTCTFGSYVQKQQRKNHKDQQHCLDSSRSTSWIKDEEVYVSQPPSFVDPDHPKKVYKVAKALYGLHQAPRACVKTAITLWRPRLEHIDKKDEELMMLVDDHPLKNMEDRGIFDSGCSGHMTGNKDHLDDFEECKGGSVTFGGSKGYITGKGRIRVGNLEFDSVSFVKELGHFNLFSISQICDKQHKVLFTETECMKAQSAL